MAPLSRSDRPRPPWRPQPPADLLDQHPGHGVWAPRPLSRLARRRAAGLRRRVRRGRPERRGALKTMGAPGPARSDAKYAPLVRTKCQRSRSLLLRHEERDGGRRMPPVNRGRLCHIGARDEASRDRSSPTRVRRWLLGCGAVPGVLVRRARDCLAGVRFDDDAVTCPDQGDAGRDVEGLAHRVGLPVGVGAWSETDVATAPRRREWESPGSSPDRDVVRPARGRCGQPCPGRRRGWPVGL